MTCCMNAGAFCGRCHHCISSEMRGRYSYRRSFERPLRHILTARSSASSAMWPAAWLSLIIVRSCAVRAAAGRGGHGAAGYCQEVCWIIIFPSCAH
eukprot:364298-Chlamydomonas_euryale.AAC.10